MRPIPTLLHAGLDYFLGAVLIAFPWAAGFNAPETWLMNALGLVIVAYSVCTDYELSVVRWIPMRAHLGLDVIGGLVLIAVPWLFRFDHPLWAFHLGIGLVEIAVALLTQPVPSGHRATPVYHGGWRSPAGR